VLDEEELLTSHLLYLTVRMREKCQQLTNSLRLLIAALEKMSHEDGGDQ